MFAGCLIPTESVMRTAVASSHMSSIPDQNAARHLTVRNACSPQVSLHDIRDAVINIYRERKFLAATLRDTRTVVSRLELVIGVVVHLVFLFFYLLIFRVRFFYTCCSSGVIAWLCLRSLAAHHCQLTV